MYKRTPVSCLPPASLLLPIPSAVSACSCWLTSSLREAPAGRQGLEAQRHVALLCRCKEAYLTGLPLRLLQGKTIRTWTFGVPGHDCVLTIE
jgi:hypothetical protein